MEERKNEALKIPKLIMDELLAFSEGRMQLSKVKLESYIKQYPHILLLHQAKIATIMDSSLNTFLLNAIANNQNAAAELLIDLDITGDSLDIHDNYATGKNSPLLLALKKGNIAIAKKLIDRDVDLSCEDHFGFTPMVWAALLRADDVIAMLISKGINPHEKLELIKAGDFYNILQTFKTPRRAIKTSAYQIYKDEIKPEDLEYLGGKRAADSIYFVGTRNPLYSDLHWHVKDILNNLFHISQNQIDIWKQGPIVDSNHHPVTHAFAKSLPENWLLKKNWLSASRKIVTYHLEQESHSPQLLEGFYPEFGCLVESAKTEFAMLRGFIKPNMKLFDKEAKINVSDVGSEAKANREKAIAEYQKFTQSGKEEFEKKLNEEIASLERKTNDEKKSP